MIQILGVGVYCQDDHVGQTKGGTFSNTVVPGRSYVVLEVDGVQALSSFTTGGHEVIHETGEEFPPTVAWIIHKWIFPGAGR